jgi:hypothetical protein
MPLALRALKISDVRKQSYDYELIAMAYHESGHAICALSNFLYVFSVGVMSPKNNIGYTNWYIYDTTGVQDEELRKVLFINEIQALYAGLIAEKMYYKDICGSDEFPMHLRAGSSEDTLTASSIIRKNNIVKAGRQTHLFKKQMKRDVEQFLQEHWDAVKIIAHALYKKTRLSHDELKYLLTRKTDHRDFWKDKFKKLKTVHNDKVYPSEETVKDILLENVIYSI